MTREEWVLACQFYLDAHGVEHFTAKEVCDVGREEVRQDTGKVAVLEPPPPGFMSNVLLLIDVLEWGRAEGGGLPMEVSSWFRSPAYNAAVGGAPNSMHLVGGAGDVAQAGNSPLELAKLFNRHPTSQRLGIGLYDGFVHVDIRGMIGRLAPARWGNPAGWWR